MDREAFIGYLKDDSITEPYSVKDSRYAWSLIKSPLTEDIVAFYGQDVYMRPGDDNQQVGMKIGEDIKYRGFYSKQTGQLYDLEYSFSGALGLAYAERGLDVEQLKENLSKDVSNRVSDMIHADPSLVQGTISERDQGNLEYEINGRAKTAFFEHKDVADVVYRPSVPSERFDHQAIFSYIRSPQAAIEEQAIKYLALGNTDLYGEKTHDRMAYGLEAEKLTREKLQEINGDKSNVYHKQRDIADAVKDTEAKTIKVTIDKDGKEFTFSTEASSLERTGDNFYSSYSIKAQDRAEFEKMYGRAADYNADNVVRMTYGKKEIYSRSEGENQDKPVSREPEKERGGMSLNSAAKEAREASRALGDDGKNNPMQGQER